ncbi:MAG: hypothetical protein V4612_02115 [Pseudomonadota bacterium]
MPKKSIVENISDVKESVQKGVRSSAIMASPTLIPMQIGVVGSVAKGIGMAAGFFASVFWSFLVPGQIDGKGKPIAGSSLESIHSVSNWFARTWLSPWKYGWSAGVESAQNVVEFFGGEHSNRKSTVALPSKDETGSKKVEKQTPFLAPVNAEDTIDESGPQTDGAQSRVDNTDDNKWTKEVEQQSSNNSNVRSN